MVRSSIMNHVSLRCAVGLSLLLAAFATNAAAEPPPTDPAAGKLSPDEIDFFEKRIRPVLAERCYGCHSAKAKVVQGNLKLDTAAGLRAGGDSGPVVAAGKPKDSLLIQAVRWESLEMPPDGKLADAAIADLHALGGNGRAGPADGRRKRAGQNPTAGGRGEPLGLSAASSATAAGGQGCRLGRETRSIASSWPRWSSAALALRREPARARCCGDCTLT